MDGVETGNHPLLRLEARAVGAGLVGGFLAGIAMGLVLQFGTDLLPLLGDFVGRTSLLRGWLVHLVVSLLYGVLFTVVVAYPPIRSFMDTFGEAQYVLVGIVYAVTIAAVSISILPFVFELPWASGAVQEQLSSGPGPGIGGLVPAGLFAVAHVVYGIILGAIYGIVQEDTGYLPR